MKKLYNQLPGSLKSEVLVRARQEEPEIQSARAEIIKNKSVNELSQIISSSSPPSSPSWHVVGQRALCMSWEEAPPVRLVTTGSTNKVIFIWTVIIVIIITIIVELSLSSSYELYLQRGSLVELFCMKTAKIINVVVSFMIVSATNSYNESF